jgi:hypothetical protein
MDAEKTALMTRSGLGRIAMLGHAARLCYQ